MLIDCDIESMSLSRDGKLIVYESVDTTIYVLNLETKTEKQYNIGATDLLTDMCLSPDNRILALAYCNGFIHLLDLENGTTPAMMNTKIPCKSTVGSLHYNFRNLSFSIDGRTLIVESYKNDILLWDLAFFYEVKDRQITDDEIKEAEERYNLRLVGTELKPIDLSEAPLSSNPKPPQWPKTHPFHWSAKAKAGDAEAMVQLGLCYDRDGKNQEALEWYRKSAEAGNDYGKERLAFLTKWMADQKQKNTSSDQAVASQE